MFEKLADKGVRRRIALASYLAATSVTTLGTGILSVFVMRLRGVSLTDRLTATSSVITAGALFLSLIAGFIALQSFAVATGTPALQVQFWFGGGEKNVPRFLGKSEMGGWIETRGGRDQTILHLRVRNVARYPATNISILVALVGATTAAIVPPSEDWTLADSTTEPMVTALIQWDGGGSVIHPGSSRLLPALNCGQIRHLPSSEPPHLLLDIFAASGFHKRLTVPIEFLLEQGASARSYPHRSAEEWL